MNKHSEIRDYHRISCGCCTGKAVEVYDANVGGYRIATDQCVCWMHQEPHFGIGIARQCSVHRQDASA